MADWFCSVFNVVCVGNVCPRCRSELIDSTSVVIVPGLSLVPDYLRQYNIPNSVRKLRATRTNRDEAPRVHSSLDIVDSKLLK